MTWAKGQTHCRRGHLLSEENVMCTYRARLCRRCFCDKQLSLYYKRQFYRQGGFRQEDAPILPLFDHIPA